MKSEYRLDDGVRSKLIAYYDIDTGKGWKFVDGKTHFFVSLQAWGLDLSCFDYLYKNGITQFTVYDTTYMQEYLTSMID